MPSTSLSSVTESEGVTYFGTEHKLVMLMTVNFWCSQSWCRCCCIGAGGDQDATQSRGPPKVYQVEGIRGTAVEDAKGSGQQQVFLVQLYSRCVVCNCDLPFVLHCFCLPTNPCVSMV